MAVAFAAMSLLNWWREGPVWQWTIGIAAVFLAATLVHPPALKPLNQLWLVMRMLGKDPLRLKRQPNVDSHGIERCPPGPAPESMKDQF
jgi:hypothetical protein